MASVSATHHHVPFVRANYSSPKALPPKILVIDSDAAKSSPGIAVHALPSLHRRCISQNSVLPSKEYANKFRFLRPGCQESTSRTRLITQSAGAESGSSSGAFQSVFKLLHLIVSLGIILATDKLLKTAFVAASIKFPSALFGMFCIFSVLSLLTILDLTAPSAATSLMNFFQPALSFIQR